MDWRYNTIWFDQINDDKKFFQNLNENKTSLPNLAPFEYVTIWHLKKKSNFFEGIAARDNLLYLNLTWANLKSFRGIGQYRNLKRLELHYCTKMTDDQGIGELKNTLEFLHINQSKKYSPSDELYTLTNLKVLCLNSCEELPNLQFLANFPNLIDFRFVDTKVTDGDLSPIIQHPKIRSVGFLDKRNYNLKKSEIDLILAQKSSDELKDYVYKDEYMTYKYKDL